jgi:hypothetical protein
MAGLRLRSWVGGFFGGRGDLLYYKPKRRSVLEEDGDEVKIYRVTEIIAPFTDFSHVPPDRLEAACDRGTEVHTYLHSYALGLWSPRPEGYEGYCESGERWIDAHVRRVISSEQEYQDSILGFVGHPDLLAYTDMGLMLVDYKTPATEQRSWAIQLAAYHHLVCRHHRYGSVINSEVIPAVLMLSPAGGKSAKMKRYDDNRQYFFSLFLSALNLIKYFKEGKP